MRIKPLPAIFLLALISFGNAHIPSIDEILQTNQYLLVSQQDGFTFMETDIPSGECPQAFLKPRTNHPDKMRYVGFHLVRDPAGVHHPKIMVIRRSQSSLNINLFSINATSIFDNTGRRKVASFVDKALNVAMSKFFLKNENMVNSLFDSSNRKLYLEFFAEDNHVYEQYHLRGLFDGTFSATLLGTGSRRSSSSRYDWTEDQYAGKFYYKENVDNEIAVFEVPMGLLLSSWLDGEPGRKIGTMTVEGKLHGVSGGAFFSVNKHKIDNWTITTSLVPISLSSGIQCRSSQSKNQLPAFYGLIVIRDHDYCMLRDGSNYNPEKCDAERKDYLPLKEVANPADDFVRWLLVICLILFMLIVLLFVYIYWLRSTFVSDDERSHHHNEYETEASLFVAKQRSFPSVYQDPAQMDVSVDRWN